MENEEDLKALYRNNVINVLYITYTSDDSTVRTEDL